MERGFGITSVKSTIRPKPDCGFLHARVLPHERPSQHREFSQFLTKQESVKGLIPPYVGSAQRRRPVVRTSPNSPPLPKAAMSRLSFSIRAYPPHSPNSQAPMYLGCGMLSNFPTTRVTRPAFRSKIINSSRPCPYAASDPSAFEHNISPT